MTGLAANAESGSYPAPPEPDAETADWGKHIQRTMGLLEASTPQSRQPVKILFYGQSIIGGQWHVYVERALRERYPHADLTVENRALGGYSSAYLIKTLEHDLLASQPDLVIFHVYGDHVRYEEIIHTIRQRSSAEVMILTDHWKANSWNDEKGVLEAGDWPLFMDKLLPLIAKKYACELVDVRWPWKSYLQANQLRPGDLLKDNVHLNDYGAWVMAQLTLRQMLYRPELMTEISRGLSTTYTVSAEPNADTDLNWAGRTLNMTFRGSRVDLLRSDAGGASCQVWVDGKRPSEWPALYQHSRTTSIGLPYEWPEIMRVGFEKAPEPQVWTLTVTGIDWENKGMTFTLEGSETGPDGSGSSLEPFVSNSGQVAIDPEDWCLPRKMQWRGAEQRDAYQVGARVRWRSFVRGEDLYFPSGFLESDRLVRHTILSGLPNREYTLRLESDGMAPPITAVQVYTPMLPADQPFQSLGLYPGSADLDLSEISEPTPIE